jgi:hypothetical protein
MPDKDVRQRPAYLYAMLTSITGLLVLVRLFMQPASVDLATLLAFTLTAIIVACFRVPIGQAGAELGLDGAILLAAMLAEGPVHGGWAAFITGLVVSMIPGRTTTAVRPGSKAAVALLTSGSNVISITVAWLVYGVLGGSSITSLSSPVDISQTLAVIGMCVAYAMVQCLLAWPALVLQRMHARQTLSRPLAPARFLLKLIPLPISLLIAVVFVKMGWSFFLLLALALIGQGAVLRQMLETVRALQTEIDGLKTTNRIQAAIAATPPQVGALSKLAYGLCQQVVSAQKFELGIYDSSRTSVSIQVAVDGPVKLPPMHIPLTPQWEWIGTCQEPQLISEEALLEQLPFSLPPLDDQQRPRSAMFVPIPGAPTEQEPDQESAVQDSLGGIILLSPAADAFTRQDLSNIIEIASQVGAALRQVCTAPLPAGIKHLEPSAPAAGDHTFPNSLLPR